MIAHGHARPRRIDPDQAHTILVAGWWLLAFIGIGMSAGLASAQTLPGGGQALPGAGVGGLSDSMSSGIGGVGGLGQSAVPNASGSGRRGLTVTSRVEAGVTYTDNVGYSNNDRRSDFIFDVSPGIRITSNGGKVRGYFDYSLHAYAYASGTLPASLANELNGAATVEAVDRKVFIDVGGRITRATVSAFGVQPSDGSRDNPNVTEVRTYFVSPYARGRLFNQADYQLRYRGSVSSSEATPQSDATIQELSGFLQEDYPNRHIGWALQGGRTVVDYKTTRDIDASNARGVVSLLFTPQFRVFASAGREVNNFLTEEQRGYNTIGYGLRWRPSVRTRLEFEQQKRFFGEGHSFVFEHRAPLSAVRLSDVKDIVIGRGFDDVGSQGSLYDLLFTQFASTEPDPDKRAQLVNQFLQRNGFNGSAPVNSSVFASSTTLRRTQQLTYSLIGIRNTVTLFADRISSRLLDDAFAINGDFVRANEIRQRRVGATYAHALTANSTFNVTGTVQKANSAGDGQSANLRSIALAYTNRLAPRLFFSAGARRSFSSGSDAVSYDELSVFGRVTLQF